jgi:integrase
MRTHYPQHYALVVLLAYTGLRFCHASALHWDDWDETGGVLRVSRKQVRGKVGPVTRKKRAPKEYPVEPELATGAERVVDVRGVMWRADVDPAGRWAKLRVLRVDTNRDGKIGAIPDRGCRRS